jgi:hypothetical protein
MSKTMSGHKPHGRIGRLRQFGFAEPVKMMTSRPAVPGLSIDNIRGKFAELGALGVAEPVKMITSRPAIIELASDNIRSTIADTPRASSLRSPLPSRGHGRRVAPSSPGLKGIR